jgi:hypothetical protein
MLRTVNRAGQQIARITAVTTVVSGLLVVSGAPVMAAPGVQTGTTVTAVSAEHPGDHHGGRPGNYGPQNGNGLGGFFEAHKAYTCNSYGSSCGWHPGIGFSCSALNC